jgi:hypothetical protein
MERSSSEIRTVDYLNGDSFANGKMRARNDGPAAGLVNGRLLPRLGSFRGGTQLARLSLRF